MASCLENGSFNTNPIFSDLRKTLTKTKFTNSIENVINDMGSIKIQFGIMVRFSIIRND